MLGDDGTYVRLGGSLSADRQSLTWDDGHVWRRREAEDAEPRRRPAPSPQHQGLLGRLRAAAPPPAGEAEARSRSPQRQSEANKWIAHGTHMVLKDTAGVFFQGHCDGYKTGCVDTLKDRAWDDVARRVNERFQDKRAFSHWETFLGRVLQSQAGGAPSSSPA